MNNTKPRVIRLRVTCMAGPSLYEPCIRYIDLLPGMTLFDVHTTLQDAIRFDDSEPFYFFQASSWNGQRDCIPPTLDLDPLKETIDVDLYDELAFAAYLPESGSGKHLYDMTFGENGDWCFQIDRAGEIPQYLPDDYYPAVASEFSEGPDPVQYENPSEDPENWDQHSCRGGEDDDDCDCRDGHCACGDDAEEAVRGPGSAEEDGDDWALQQLLKELESDDGE
ncbi:MAG: hypothetical protein ACI4QT_01080 [Kiritimatiellia bacterium]